MAFLRSFSKRQLAILTAGLVLMIYLSQSALAQETVSEAIEPSPEVPAVVEIPVEASTQPTDMSVPEAAAPLIETVVVVPVEPTVLPTLETPVELPINAPLVTVTVVAPEIVIDPVPTVASVEPEPLVEAAPVIIVPVSPTHLPAGIVPPVVENSGLAQLSGRVEVSHAGIQAAVHLVSAGVVQQVVVAADGSFSFAAQPGDYQLVFSAPRHLPYLLALTVVSAEPLALSAIRLPDGDIDSNGVIDMGDVSLVVSGFGGNGQAAVDLNGDGEVNIYDLSIVSGNAR